jgi:hypothetical protein
MSEFPTKPVQMTLEESGLLCHLLLPEIMKARARLNTPPNTFDTVPIRQHILEVMVGLYDKLAEINDQLMRGALDG